MSDTDKMNNLIYLDHAATTHVKQQVLEEMLPYLTGRFGNPSTIYSLGREARKAMETARAKTAAALGAKHDEVYFTGSGTESINWAIRGTAAAAAESGKGRHIITTNIEHHAVLHTCNALEKEGFEISYLPVSSNGLIAPEQVEDAIKDSTVLITVMTANNEIGTIQPITEIGRIARARGIIFHTDAVQAIGNIPVSVNSMNVDLLSLIAHKFYGPKGIGALYVRKGTRISPFMYGGAQEKGRRAGTENVPGIAGLGKAIELAAASIGPYSSQLLTLRERLIDKVLSTIPYARLNGDRSRRLPGNVNFSFEFIEGESLLLMLDSKNIAASSGSACTSGSLDPSHVLLAIGLPHEIAHGSLRITFGEANTLDDVDKLAIALVEIVDRLREMSPLYDKKGSK